jgi:hypothetical protein
MSDLITGDWEAFKSSCQVVFENPNPNFGYVGPVGLCGICSALVLMSDTTLGSHWNWHYTHYANHSIFAPHCHSPVTGLVVGLPDGPGWDKTFG